MSLFQVFHLLYGGLIQSNTITQVSYGDMFMSLWMALVFFQVVAKPEYKFLEDSLYQNISILIWDPANFTSTLEEWYHHPDYALFPVYLLYV